MRVLNLLMAAGASAVLLKTQDAPAPAATYASKEVRKLK